MNNSFRILVVDDDPVVASMYKMILSALEVEAALTANAGLARLSDTTQPKIHCVVLDLTLPNGQGLDLVKRYRKSAPDVPVIVLTGYNYSPDDVVAAGACVLFRKPADPRQLMDVIARAIGEYHAQARLSPAEDAVTAMKQEIDEACEGRAAWHATMKQDTDCGAMRNSNASRRTGSSVLLPRPG